MSRYEMEYPLLEVIKHANQHLMETFRLDEIAHNIWTLSKYIELSVKMAQ
jgi:cellobiose-specific phosphotransferase system component IIA